jgi:hypothetical protein
MPSSALPWTEFPRIALSRAAAKPPPISTPASSFDAMTLPSPAAVPPTRTSVELELTDTPDASLPSDDPSDPSPIRFAWISVPGVASLTWTPLLSLAAITFPAPGAPICVSPTSATETPA